MAKQTKKKTKKSGPILAAGGIVTRGRSKPVFAVVRLRRQKSWVLPKGKLNKDETTIAAAKREVIEETGHDVVVQDYLGSLDYLTSGRPKIVKFWHMEASRKPVAKLMKDVSAVRWLPLDKAIKKLTHAREREFLTRFGPRAQDHLRRSKDARVHERPSPPPRTKTIVGIRPLRQRGGAPLKVAYSSPKEFVQVLWRWLRH